MKTIATIEGTHCKSCKLLIEDVCKDMEGVTSCRVEVETGKTIIEHDERFDKEAFKSEVEGLGEYKLEFNL